MSARLSTKRFRKIISQIDDAVEKGAKVLAGARMTETMTKALLCQSDSARRCRYVHEYHARGNIRPGCTDRHVF